MTTPATPHRHRRQIALVLVSVGGMLAAGSLVYFIYSIIAASHMVATTGTVDRIERRRERREDPDDPSDRRFVTVRRPIVQYQVNHVTYEREMGGTLGWEAGDAVEVLYSQDNPAAGIVNTIWERWGLLLIFEGFGWFFLLGGWLILPRAASTKPSMFVWNEDAPALGFVLIGLAVGGPLTGFLWSGSLTRDFPAGVFLLISLAVLILFPWVGFYLLYRQVRARWCFACHGPREKWNDYWYQCPECNRGRWFDIPDGDKSKYQRRRQS